MVVTAAETVKIIAALMVVTALEMTVPAAVTVKATIAREAVTAMDRTVIMVEVALGLVVIMGVTVGVYSAKEEVAARVHFVVVPADAIHFLVWEVVVVTGPCVVRLTMMMILKLMVCLCAILFCPSPTLLPGLPV
jgi:hypothetical protein